MRLQLEDFERKVLDGGAAYLSWTNGDVEICIEPCLNGCDVAVYRHMELLEPKFCTNITDWTKNIEDVFKVNDLIEQKMNKYYKKYVKKHES